MYADISQRLSFSISTRGEVLGNTAYFFTGNNLQYLLKVLNTKLIDWYYRSLSVQLGEKAVRMFSIYVLKLPIPKFINSDLQQKIVATKEDDNIEKFVHKLYGLSGEEIEFIENQL